MILEKLVCESCGGTDFKKTGSYYKCDFCGSRYTINNNESSKNGSNLAPEIVAESLADAEIVSCYKLAQKYYEEGKHSEELKILTEALSIDENNSQTLNKLGRCYTCLGMKDEAIKYYTKAIEIEPQNGFPYLNMGVIHIRNREWEEADAYFKKGFPLINDEKNTLNYWTSYANYAIVVARLGNPVRAECMISEAEEHGYSNGEACRSLAGLGKKGCYIATCVYGSYDCPEVWTLRRFRDYKLATSWYGRAFIRTYYAISPKLVTLFGDTVWFKRIWKEKLDKMVNTLNKQGYKNTKYTDEN